MPRLFSIFVAFIASFLLIGSAQAEVKVLTSIKPLQLIAAAVQDGVAIPEVLLPPGASPHNYALRPSDVRKVQSVDLLYWIGPDMEGFLPRVLNGRTLPTVAVQDLPGLKLRHFAEDNHSHAEEADEHDHDHRPGSLDAHLWLSPINARVIATKIHSFPFHPELIDLADASVKEVCGVSHRLPSGPLHDAAEVCRAGVPTVMLFVQSLHGISHNKIEDTKEEHLEMSVRALDRLARKTIAWIEQKR